MDERPRHQGDTRLHDGAGARSAGELGLPVRLYDPRAMCRAIGDDVGYDGFVGPDDEAPAAPALNVENEVRARRLRRILADPRGAWRPALHGTRATLARLAEATTSMPHFSAVTGVVARAAAQSALTARPLSLPPILMVSPPGLGKTHYCRAMAGALRTTCVPIAVNGTSDRGRLGGLSPLWRGADMGRIARGLLVEGATAAPLFLLDEIDKAPMLVAGENTLDVLLSALEPESAGAFVDEYLDVPIDLRSALWLASANSTAGLSAPLLDRMLVVEVPWPGRDAARVIARSIAGDVLARTGLAHVADAALDPLCGLAPRRMRRVLEAACGFSAAAGRLTVGADDVAAAIDVVVDRRRSIGFLASAASGDR